MAAAVKTFKSERAKAGAGPENSGCLLLRVRCEYPAVISICRLLEVVFPRQRRRRDKEEEYVLYFLRKRN